MTQTANTTNSVELAIAPYLPNGDIDKSKARYIRVISDDLSEQKQTDQSQELVKDNTVRDVLTVGMDTTGSFSFELSYGSFDDILTTFLRNSWVDNQDGTETLTNGTEDHSFVIEKKVGQYFYTFYNCKGNEFSVSKATRSRLTGTMSFVATDAQLSTTSVFQGETIAPVNTTRVMTSYSNLQQHEGLAKITTFDYTINNNAAPREDLFSTFDIAQRQFQLTGSGTMFFIDDDLYNQFKNSQVVPFGIRVEQNEEEYYIFKFNAPVITELTGIGGSGGTNTDIFQDFSFEATSQNGPVIEIVKGKIVET